MTDQKMVDLILSALKGKILGPFFADGHLHFCLSNSIAGIQTFLDIGEGQVWVRQQHSSSGQILASIHLDGVLDAISDERWVVVFRTDKDLTLRLRADATLEVDEEGVW